MSELSTGSSRPPQPPIDRLRQILDLPGACKRIWELGFMSSALPVARVVLAQQTLHNPSFLPAERLLRTHLMSCLLLDRISVSLEEVAAAASEERRGITKPMAGTPLSERRFTFAHITYLSALSMVELGTEPDVIVEMDEAMREETKQEMLFAGPAVCDAFNGTVAIMSLPSQRRRGSYWQVLNSNSPPRPGTYPPSQG